MHEFFKILMVETLKKFIHKLRFSNHLCSLNEIPKALFRTLQSNDKGDTLSLNIHMISDMTT